MLGTKVALLGLEKHSQILGFYIELGPSFEREGGGDLLKSFADGDSFIPINWSSGKTGIRVLFLFGSEFRPNQDADTAIDTARGRWWGKEGFKFS